MKAFKINGGFTVFPERNMVNNVKLEPRLMKLLCLLVKNSGKVVSREQIVNEIWQGYGGGEEGLTQAVSFLRKILNDTDKKIIETVSKAGYVFNGEAEEIGNVNSEELNKASPKRLVMIAAILLAVILIFLLLNRKTSDNYAPQAQPDEQQKQTPAVAPEPK